MNKWMKYSVGSFPYSSKIRINSLFLRVINFVFASLKI